MFHALRIILRQWKISRKKTGNWPNLAKEGGGGPPPLVKYQTISRFFLKASLIQDVYNHMGEALEQMFRVLDVEPKDQSYKLDVFQRTNEHFPIKIEIMKSKNVKAVMDNFRRQGHVKGGGCVKFYQKFL